MRKILIIAFIVLIFSIGGCAMEFTAGDYAIRLKDKEEFLANRFLLMDTNPLVITVENFGQRPTGRLTVMVDGVNAGSFTVSPEALESIPVGGTASITVQPLEGTVQISHAAVVEIKNSFVNTTLNISYRNFGIEPDQTLFYGYWRNGNIQMIITENSYTYRHNANGINVTSVIHSWTEEVWTVNVTGDAGPAGTEFKAFRLHCTVLEAVGYLSPGNYMNAMFNIIPQPVPQESGQLESGQEYSFILLCKDWYNINGAGSSGINIGIVDYGGTNRVPWVNFFRFN